MTQVTRIILYQRSLEEKSAGQIAEGDAKEAADTAKGVAKNPERAVEKAVN